MKKNTGKPVNGRTNPTNLSWVCFKSVEQFTLVQLIWLLVVFRGVYNLFLRSSH